MADAILQVDNLVKRFGGVAANDSASLAVAPDELHALIGPNGAGKTTFISQLAGEIMPDSGSVHFLGEDVTALSTPQRTRRGLVRSFQITSIFPRLSAEDNVALAVQATQGHSYRFWAKARRDPSLREPARAMLDQVGLQGRAEASAGDLAHGEQRQLEIAMALASRPKMLLLDEPMAGMGSDESQRIIAILQSLKGRLPMLLVEHDMDAVFALADTISVLVRGKVMACGAPVDIRNNPEVRASYLGEEEG